MHTPSFDQVFSVQNNRNIWFKCLRIATFQEAIDKGSFYRYSNSISNGDTVKGLELADHVVEGEVNMGGQEHFYLETHAVLAVPKGEDDEMELFVSTQNPTETQVCY